MRFLVTFIICLLAFSSSSFANEGAGLIFKDSQGALPKSLWREQPRSEIVYLLKNLPNTAPLRSIQQIKQNMLLSVYDTSSINNDINPSNENNLLNLRLQKLIELGVWDKAFELYTNAVSDPKDNALLAETGVFLVLLEKGFATACLEHKTLRDRFEKVGFWQQIDTICSLELDLISPSIADYSGSNVLDRIYNDASFLISSNNIAQLSSLSHLELAILWRKNRINYGNTNLNSEIPPFITSIFLKDKNFPNTQKDQLHQLAINQALLLIESLPENSLESFDSLTQNQIINIISHHLRSNKGVSSQEIEKLYDFADLHLENYVYLKYIQILDSYQHDREVSEDQFLSSSAFLSKKHPKKVNFLKSLLDKSPEFSNNLVNAYEKQVINATKNVIMTNQERTDWLNRTIKNNYAGLSLLIMLSNIQSNTWVTSSGDISEENAFNMLKNLSNVGLIDQAHQIAREELANLMSFKN